MIKLNYIASALIGLVILALIAFYHPTRLIDIKHSTQPDAIMEDVITKIFDKFGKLQLKIATPRMTHYNDTTDLATPEVTIYRKSPQPWRITAEHGKASESAEKVDFWDNVIVQHAGDQNMPTTLIKTTSLTLYPIAETAQTNDAITLIQPNIVVQSIGMFADMESGNIKLLSKAVGEYVPDKK